jgi:hypothetical protein
MLVTVENQLAVEINKPAVGEDGIALPGGNHPEEATHREYPLPYPFGPFVGTLDANGGASDSAQLPMNPRDWRYSRSQMKRGMPVSEAWNQLVQAGVVTFAIAAQANVRDVEELFMDAV